MEQNERWAPNYAGIYSIDTNGNIYSYKFKKKKKLQTRQDTKGYLLIGLPHCK